MDERVGYIITVIGIPSAFLLHGYVGFIFGSVKANPWWSSPMMPVVFIFSAMVSGIAAVMLFYMFADLDARPRVIDMRLRGHHRASTSFTFSSSISAGNAGPDSSDL